MSAPSPRKIPRQAKHIGEFSLRPTLIDRPGIYDLPMDVYHGSCCAGHSVSGGDLVIIEQESLAHYWHQSYLNPERERKTSKAMEMGKAAHFLQLGELEFSRHYIISPYENFRSGESQAWRDSQDKTVISKADFDKIGAMARALAAHPFAKRAFRDGRPEMSIIWQDGDSGIWLKSRPDWLGSTSPWTPNFKTAASSNPREWYKSAFSLGYHQKEALRVDGFKAIGRECQPYFVVQETTAPYVVSVIVMRPQDLEMGRLLNRAALRRLATALKTKKWPGYDNGEIAKVAMPPWQETEILARLDAGEFKGLVEGEQPAKG